MPYTSPYMIEEAVLPRATPTKTLLQKMVDPAVMPVPTTHAQLMGAIDDHCRRAYIRYKGLVDASPQP